MLNNTFRYVSKITWGGLKTVYVLDDSVRRKFATLRIIMTSGTSCS